jgi:hypothetical protein
MSTRSVDRDRGLLERFRRAEEEWARFRATVGRCAFAERLVTGCCERHYRCHHRAQDGNVYEPRQCSDRCAYYTEMA